MGGFIATENTEEFTEEHGGILEKVKPIHLVFLRAAL